MQVSGLTSGYNLSNHLPEGVHLAKKILVKKGGGLQLWGGGGSHSQGTLEGLVHSSWQWMSCGLQCRP